jgi:hypothetical protein
MPRRSTKVERVPAPCETLRLRLAGLLDCPANWTPYELIWNDLERIWKPLGLSVEGSWDDAVLQAQLASRFPGAF